MSLGEKFCTAVGIVIGVVFFPITIPLYMCLADTSQVEDPQPVSNPVYKNGKPYPRQEPTPNEIAAGIV
jgi:hypothetical protein